MINCNTCEYLDIGTNEYPCSICWSYDQRVSQGTEKEWHGETGDEHKTDFGKVDMSLMLDFRLAMEQVCKLSEFGAKKYSRQGWLAIDDINRVTAAMLRHLYKEDIEDTDPDSGVAHDTAVAWNALARLELRLRKAE